MELFTTLSKFRNTILPAVLGRPLFWICLSVHVTCLVLSRIKAPSADDPDVEVNVYNLPSLEVSTLGTLTALLTFFLVFYGGQSYTRMQTFYASFIGMGGTAQNWMLLLNTYYDDDAIKWNAARHILASHHLFCYLLNESSGATRISQSEWQVLTRRKLLKPKEIAALDTFSGFKPALPLAWALKEIHASSHAGQSGVDYHLIADFRRLAFAFRGHCGAVANWMAQPVPFAYLHALTLLLVVNMLLIGSASSPRLHVPATPSTTHR